MGGWGGYFFLERERERRERKSLGKKKIKTKKKIVPPFFSPTRLLPPVNDDNRLVKNLALMAYVSVGCAQAPVQDFLDEWGTEGLEEVSASVVPSATKVFLNGSWVGVHRDPASLVATLRAMRRQVDINTEVGIVHDVGLQELRLYTDAGRCCRPLIVVDPEDQGGRLRLRKEHVNSLARRHDAAGERFGWQELVWGGFVEYVGEYSSRLFRF